MSGSSISYVCCKTTICICVILYFDFFCGLILHCTLPACSTSVCMVHILSFCAESAFISIILTFYCLEPVLSPSSACLRSTIVGPWNSRNEEIFCGFAVLESSICFLRLIMLPSLVCGDGEH